MVIGGLGVCGNKMKDVTCVRSLSVRVHLSIGDFIILPAAASWYHRRLPKFKLAFFLLKGIQARPVVLMRYDTTVLYKMEMLDRSVDDFMSAVTRHFLRSQYVYCIVRCDGRVNESDS